MSELSISIGNSTIESRKWPLKIDSQVSVGFRSSRDNLRLDQLSEVSGAGFLNQDHWVRRIQYLRVSFQVSVVSDLPPSRMCETNLAEALKQSIITAELWEQLGLELVHDRISLKRSTNTSDFQLSISLRERRRHDRDHRIDGGQFVDDGHSNLRPPQSVTSHQLTSVCYKIAFTPLPENQVSLCRRTKRSERGCQLAACIQLVDSVLRSSIAYKPTQMFGVKIGARHQPYSLSMIAPSTFIPGYAKLLAGRTKLIEPIAKFLLAFSNRTFLNPSFTDDGDVRVEDKVAKQSSYNKIEADLWITMASALKSDHYARRLKPLKSSSRVLDSSDLEFEELHHMQVHDDSDRFQDAMMLEDGLGDDEHLLFDMLEMYSINNLSMIPCVVQTPAVGPPNALSNSIISSDMDNTLDEGLVSEHGSPLLLSEPNQAERCRSEVGSSQHKIRFLDTADAEFLEQDIIDLDLPYRDKAFFMHTHQTRSDEDMLDLWPVWTKKKKTEVSWDGRDYRDHEHIVDTGSDEEEMFLDTWKTSLQAPDMLL